MHTLWHVARQIAKLIVSPTARWGSASGAPLVAVASPPVASGSSLVAFGSSFVVIDLPSLAFPTLSLVRYKRIYGGTPCNHHR